VFTSPEESEYTMLKNKELVNDINNCTLDINEVAFWWLGQHSFVLKINNSILYIDPFLSDRSDRLLPPLLNAEEIVNANLILGSHDHIDHIDHPLLQQFVKLNSTTKLIVPELLRNSLIEELKISPDRVFGCGDNFTVQVDGIKVTGIAAAHEFFDQDTKTGHFPYLGFIIETDNFTIYHSGDTCLYEGMETKLQKWDFDIAFVPINGRDAKRLRANCLGNMTYQEAADLCGNLKPKLIVPAHYGMFAGNTIDPKLFTDYMDIKYPNLKTHICTPGQRYIYKK